MASDFNKPVQSDGYLDVLETIRDDQDASAVMFNGVSVSNIPVNAVRFNNGSFSLWDGAAWNVSAVSIAGGGTGATTAAGARSNLDVLSSGELSSQYLRKDGNLSGLTDKPLAFNTVKQSATTSSSGVVEKAESSEMSGGTADKFPDCATIKGYYGEGFQEATLSAPSNDFTTGYCEVVRQGRVVTITGRFTHSSLQQPGSNLGFLPSWAIPSNQMMNVPDIGSGITKIVVDTGGRITFFYIDYSGSGVNRTTTGTQNFTISYTVD